MFWLRSNSSLLSILNYTTNNIFLNENIWGQILTVIKWNLYPQMMYSNRWRWIVGIIMHYPVKNVHRNMVQAGVMEIVNGETISAWKSNLTTNWEFLRSVRTFNDCSISCGLILPILYYLMIFHKSTSNMSLVLY